MNGQRHHIIAIQKEPGITSEPTCLSKASSCVLCGNKETYTNSQCFTTVQKNKAKIDSVARRQERWWCWMYLCVWIFPRTDQKRSVPLLPGSRLMLRMLCGGWSSYPHLQPSRIRPQFLGDVFVYYDSITWDRNVEKNAYFLYIFYHLEVCQSGSI